MATTMTIKGQDTIPKKVRADWSLRQLRAQSPVGFLSFFPLHLIIHGMEES